MNTLRNKVQLIGNLGNDPEIINLENGKKMAKFLLATNDSYKNVQGENVTQTHWYNLIAWNKTAEIVEKYVTKGKEITIEPLVSFIIPRIVRNGKYGVLYCLYLIRIESNTYYRKVYR